MAQLIIRNIENDVKERIKRRARQHGFSMEQEVREILRNVANEEVSPACGLGTDLSALFAKVGFKSDIPELRGYTLSPRALSE